MTRPRIFFENDSRHTLIYMYEPPIQAEEQMSAVDEIVGTPVEALVFNLGYGNAFLHGTDVADRWGPAAAATEQFRPDGGARWNHMVFQRAYRNAAKLIAEGNDPLRLICDRAHEKGLLVYPSLQLPIALYRDQDRVLTIGAAGAAPDEASGQADYAQRAVRDQRLAIIAEAVANYPLDGFELNFSCPHGHPETNMGAAMGQNPPMVEEVTRWCVEATDKPVWAKMTPNIGDIRLPARADSAAGRRCPIHMIT